MSNLRGHAWTLGLAAVACIALASALRFAMLVVRVPALDKAASLGALAFPLAALALAEPARLARDRAWGLVAALAAFGAAPAAGVWLADGPRDPVNAVLGAAFLAGAAALAVAAHRAAAARGLPVPGWAWALLAAYVVAEVVRGPLMVALVADPFDAVYFQLASADLEPLLLLGFVLATGRAGDPLRRAGAATAVGGGLAAAALVLSLVPRETTFSDAMTSPEYLLASVAWAVGRAGIVLVAMGIGSTTPGDRGAEPGPAATA